jgi:ATP-dependent Lon protease
LALGKGPVRETAMTGEISLKGKILKIGGVKEKVLAAKREKVTNLIFPISNKIDIDDLSDHIKSGL